MPLLGRRRERTRPSGPWGESVRSVAARARPPSGRTAPAPSGRTAPAPRAGGVPVVSWWFAVRFPAPVPGSRRKGHRPSEGARARPPEAGRRTYQGNYGRSVQVIARILDGVFR
ncbi:hypothetical protein GCM10018793_22300 [Streptomyces sulfonofaciens]|uniref:Uncharacterized protein n=1 Tax=Streptomyces sulfonofaciens TaxID=68272 RepID=A0A919G1M1_9ACTN|nr:hypothetical protein GCM10018793_22300 [Streptomyces sulfonofaciens]